MGERIQAMGAWAAGSRLWEHGRADRGYGGMGERIKAMGAWAAGSRLWEHGRPDPGTKKRPPEGSPLLLFSNYENEGPEYIQPRYKAQEVRHGTTDLVCRLVWWYW